MDETTEPVIGIVGHPIAGNPSQFAIERVLQALRFDARVLSFDVQPARLAAALDGAEALGFRGLLIDRKIIATARDWLQQRSRSVQPDASFVDCFYRTADNADEFTAMSAEETWLTSAIVDHFRRRGRRMESVLTLGEGENVFSPSTLSSRLTDLAAESSSGEVVDSTVVKQIQSSPSSEEIDWADLVLIGPHVAFGLDIARWPPSDSSTLVVDLTDEGHLQAAQMQDLGYHVLSVEQRRVGVLTHCLRRWIGHEPPGDVLADAIEEYLGV